MMGAFVRARNLGALVACAVLGIAIIGRCVRGADTPSGGATASQAARPIRVDRMAALARLAVIQWSRRAVDWRIGDLPSVRVAGEVLLDGEPVAGADVSVAATPDWPEVTTVVTDEHGRFDLGYQAPLPTHVVARTGSARGIREIDLAEHVAAGRVWLIVTVKPCEDRVSGRLVDREKRPLAGVPLQESIDEWEPTLVHAGHSGADGTFSLCGKAAVAGGGSLAQVVVRTREAGDVVLGPPFTVRGRVIWSDGEPVEAALVEVDPADDAAEVTARTARRGEWSVEIATGCAVLAARHRGRYARLNDPAEPDSHHGPPPHEVCGEAGDTVVAPPIVLERCKSTARGVVRVGGNPAAGLVVSIGEQQDLTDASGGFAIACAYGFVEIRGHDVADAPYLEDDGQDDFLQLDASPSPWIRGRVTLAGQPVRGATVRIGREKSIEPPSTTASGVDGSYAVQVPAGAIFISAEGPGGIRTASPERRVVLATGSSGARIDLDMGGPTSIQGSLHLEDGTAVTGQKVLLYRSPTGPVPHAEARTDGHGFFQLAPAPGRYWLEVNHWRWRLADGREQIPLTVTASGSLDLDLVVEREPESE